MRHEGLLRISIIVDNSAGCIPSILAVVSGNSPRPRDYPAPGIPISPPTRCVLSGSPLSPFLPFPARPSLRSTDLPRSSYSYLSFFPLSSALCVRFVPNYFIGYITSLRFSSSFCGFITCRQGQKSHRKHDYYAGIFETNIV